MSPPATPLPTRDVTVQHVSNTIVASKTPESTREGVREYGVAIPDTMTGAALTSLMALTSAHRDGHLTAVITLLMAGVVGLHLIAGFSDDGVFICIDPEFEYQPLVKSAFRAAGIRPNRQRPPPSQPLEVMDRLAADPYDLVYLDVAPATLRATQEKA